MDEKRIADKVAGVVTAVQVQDPAIIIDFSDAPAKNLVEAAKSVDEAFKHARDRLEGLRRAGAGNTEADTLMKDVLRRIEKLEKEAVRAAEICRASLKWRG